MMALLIYSYANGIFSPQWIKRATYRDIAVPWRDFKVSPNASLLVLDTTKVAMGAAPQVTDDQFTKARQFDLESQKVNAYWTSRIKVAAATN